VLSSWESFYVIVGSSGGALIGLQFVVITLIAGRRNLAKAGALAAFGTPTVVHLAGALLVSAIMSAPWTSLGTLSLVLLACGVGGLAYCAIVVRRARRQTDYEPVREDWVWHVVLPFASYGALTVSAALMVAGSRHALFVIGTSALGLLVIGIHNAWDTVTHVVISGSGEGA
jgi:hypothetical protein